MDTFTLVTSTSSLTWALCPSHKLDLQTSQSPHSHPLPSHYHPWPSLPCTVPPTLKPFFGITIPHHPSPHHGWPKTFFTS
jgi:hypothetical protein